MRWSERWRRWRTPAWRGWVMDGVLILALFLGIAAYQTRKHVSSGRPAPSFAVRDLAGNAHRLEDYLGKPVVLVWWAPWCGVCAQETSTISSLAKSVEGRSHVLSVVADYRDLASVRAFQEKHGVDYPVLLGNDALRDAYGVDVYPSIFFVDSKGRVAHSVVGYTTGLGLRARLWLTP